jgi:hypothetical protein
VSFEVRWFDEDDRMNPKNRSNGFAGEFVYNKRRWNGPASWGISITSLLPAIDVIQSLH